MYCSYCGAAMSHATNYCKRCGTQLGAAKGEDLDRWAGITPDSLIWAIVVVFAVGLGANMGLIAVMRHVGNFKPDVIMWITLCLILLMLTIESVFIWLLVGRKRNPKESGEVSQLKEQVIKEMVMKELSAMKEPDLVDRTPSVAENTTRSFEPNYSESKSE